MATTTVGAGQSSGIPEELGGESLMMGQGESGIGKLSWPQDETLRRRGFRAGGTGVGRGAGAGRGAGHGNTDDGGRLGQGRLRLFSRRGRSGAVPGSFGKFALFGEVLLVGVYVAVLSLPIVTALPAVAAGVAHLRRFIDGKDDSFAAFWADFKAACSGVWLLSVGSLVSVLLVALNLWAVSTGALPGGAVVGVVSAVFGVGIVVGLLRAAGAWTPGARWWTLFVDGVRSIPQDPVGSALLFCAVLMAVVFVWMLKPLLVVVGGLMSFAVVAVGYRS